MNKLLKSVLTVVAAALTIVSAHAEPDQQAETLFKNLMTATVANDYDGFLAVCDAPMKAALTKAMLAGASAQIAPRAKAGYEAQYLGRLKQHGYEVHLWRVAFPDGGDDLLATLSVKDGKAGGFYLH